MPSFYFGVKMKSLKTLLLSLALLIAPVCFAQNQQQGFSTGNISAAGSSCNLVNSASCVVLPLMKSALGASITVSGGFSGTLNFQATTAAGVVTSLSATPVAGGTAVTSTTSTGTWSTNLTGLSTIQVSASPWTSGVATITIQSSNSSGSSSGPSGLGGVVLSGAPAKGSVPTATGSTTASWQPPLNAFSNVGVYVASPNCLGVTNCFTVKADGQSVTDATFTAGSSTVTTGNSDPSFCDGVTLTCSAYLLSRGHTTDIGAVYAGMYNCQANSEASCTYNCAQGTITAVNSAHSVTLSGTCTNNSSVTANSNNFVWASDDAAQLTAAFNAMDAAAKFLPLTLILPCGIIGMGTQSFIDIYGGTRQWPIGIAGCGPGQGTIVWPFPKMNCTGSGVHGCLIDDAWANNGLGVLGASDKFTNILFTGFGIDDKDSSATYTAQAGISCNFFCAIDDVAIVGWNWNRSETTPLYGFYCTGCTMKNAVGYAGGNFDLFAVGNSSVPATILGGSFGASIANSIRIGAGQVITSGVYCNATRSSSFTDPLATCVYNTAGNWTDYGSYIAGMWNATGGISILNGSKLNGQGAQYDMVLAGGEVHLRNVITVHNANMTGGSLFDEGGNTQPFFPTALTKSAGTIFGSASVTGVAITSAKLVLNGSWGASAAWTSLTGATQQFQGTVTNTGAGQAANPIITYTFPQPFLDATNLICEMHQVGGTQTILATTEFLTPSSVTTTGVVFTYNGTPTVNLTEVFQGSCRIP